LAYLLLSLVACGGIHWGNDSYAIVFEDKNLKPTEKKAILEDIQNVLSTTPGAADSEKNGDKTNQYDRLAVGSKGHFWPRPLWESNFGEYRLNKNTSERELYVSKELSLQYQQAIAFRSKHRDIFESLVQFLAKLNNGFDPAVMELDEKQALFWFSPEQQKWTEEKYYDNNLNEMKTIHFHWPSILTVKETAIDGKSYIYCKPVVSVKGSSNTLDQMTLIFDGVLWRIGAF